MTLRVDTVSERVTVSERAKLYAESINQNLKNLLSGAISEETFYGFLNVLDRAFEHDWDTCPDFEEQVSYAMEQYKQSGVE
jgi:hypothetical protein